MWSLIDKTMGRELLFSNEVVRPCNLAIRNAWSFNAGRSWESGI